MVPVNIVTTTRHGAAFSVRVQPGAKRTALVGLHDSAYKIALQSPPVDGKANAALLAFLAQLLNTPRSSLTIFSGEASRTKRIACSSMSASEVQRRLQAAFPVA